MTLKIPEQFFSYSIFDGRQIRNVEKESGFLK